jgi:hypothetical protein
MDIIIQDDIGFALMDFGVETPTVTTESLSYQVISRAFPVHRYYCKLNTVALKRGLSQRGFEAKLEAVNGRAGLIQVKIPECSSLLGNMAGVLTVVNSAALGAQQLLLNTTSGLIANALRSGTHLQFGNGTKVYKVLNDANSDGAGNITVDLTLPLLSAVPAGTVVTYDDIYFTMRQRTDKRSYKISNKSKHSKSVLDLREEI